MINFGAKKIAEIFHGSTLIGKIYKGKTKVYEINPYEKHTVLATGTVGEYETVLPRGVYKIALCGALGKAFIWAASGIAWVSYGGGGGFVEVIFYNSKARHLKIVAASSGSSYMELDGVRMLTAGAGGNAGPSASGAGGKITIADELDIISIEHNTAGHSGAVYPQNTGSVSSVSIYDNWGSTKNPSGGARLEYIQYVR